jgi:hypothetical protein
MFSNKPKDIKAGNAAFDARQAYQTSPEGQIRQAGAEGQQALGDKARGIADEAAVTGAQGDEDAANAQQALGDFQKIQQETDRQAKAKQALVEQTHAQLDEMVNKRAAMKVDDNRLWSNMGTARKIGLGIAVALTALGDALQHKSGPNAALAIINDAIAKDVDAQVRERNSLGEDIGLKRQSLDDYTKELGDINAARNARIAELTQKAAMMTRATAAKYESPLAKAKAEQLAADLEGQAATLKLNTATQVADQRFKQAELTNQQANTAISAGHLKLGREQLDEQKREHNDAMSNDLIKALLTSSGKSSEEAAKQAQAVKQLGMIDYKTVPGPDGKPTSQAVVLTNADGTPWTAPTEKEAQDLRAKRAAVETMIPVIDEVRRLHAKYGGSSDILKSPEWQKAKADWAALKLKEKDLNQLGAISGSDMELIDGILGASDPTSFRDIAPGLDKARDNMVLTFNKSLHHEGNYTGPDVEFPDSAAAGTPQDSPAQERVKSILEYNPDRPTMAESSEVGGVAGTVAHKIPPSYLQTIDTMIATAESPLATPEQKQTASAFLDSVQKDARFSGIRDYVDTKRGEFAKLGRDVARHLKGQK